MSPLADWLQRALQLHQAGQWGPAEQLYRQILQVDPEHAQALQLLGALAQQAGHSEAAVGYLQRALARGAGSAIVYFNLGQAYRTLGRLDEARACYEEVLRQDPGHADAPYYVGQVLQGQGRLEEACVHFAHSVRLRPGRAEAHLRLGSLHQRLGRLEEARHCYEQALRLQPNAAEIHSNLGALFKVQGRLDEALTCLQRAVALQPNLASAHLNLGAVYQAHGRLDDAVVCYQQALRAAPGHAEAHNNLGTAFKEQGRLDEAQAFYQEALRLKPDFADAHYNLGALFKERGQREEARTCFEQVLRLQPDHAAAHVALTEVLREQAQPFLLNRSQGRDRTILVYTGGFDLTIGGYVVLHKLCHLLSKKGLDARLWLYTENKRTHYGTVIANGTVDPRDCVVIYPEVINGDPLQARHVIRWLLYTPGSFGNTFTSKPSDLLVSYTKHYARHFPGCEQLCVFETWPEIFRPNPAVQRSGGCFTVRKGTHKKRIPETEGLLEIMAYDFAHVRHLFTTREVFYCYDAMTFLSVFAAMCGCLSVVIPEPDLTKQEWLDRFPLLRYGIAYGVEDRPWAEQTLGLVRQNLQEEEERSEKQVDRLIERIAELR